MSNLKTYLAEKYMSGPKADVILSRTGPLKKKRKVNTGSTIIRDDDAAWGEMTEGQAKEETLPLADEQPTVVDAPFAGGLMNAQQWKKMPHNFTDTNDVTAEEIARARETVYRDSSGKKIDTKAARAEAARLKRLREEKEAQKMEWGKGIVQKDEAEKRRQELEKQRGTAFARHADDKDLNEELKAKELWNDPAAAFLTKKKLKGPQKPEYKGPPPTPNRFGIKPGYRWDGVDRGNGFEKKLFQSQNSRKRTGAESYQWSVDDM